MPDDTYKRSRSLPPGREAHPTMPDILKTISIRDTLLFIIYNFLHSYLKLKCIPDYSEPYSKDRNNYLNINTEQEELSIKAEYSNLALSRANGNL